MSDRLSIETAIGIAAPRPLIWSILTAFEDYGVWNHYIPHIHGAAGAGAVISVRTRDTGSGMEMTRPVRVEALDPYLMHWVGEAERPGEFRGDHFFELIESAPGETIFRHYEQFSGTLAAALYGHYGDAIRSNFATFNACLKTCSEADRRASAAPCRAAAPRSSPDHP